MFFYVHCVHYSFPIFDWLCYILELASPEMTFAAPSLHQIEISAISGRFDVITYETNPLGSSGQENSPPLNMNGLLPGTVYNITVNVNASFPTECEPSGFKTATASEIYATG